jgi:MerR family mercuric resistance operon transcriptional regulator
MENFSIGALAKAAAVGVETIRYYQRRRLLPQPARAPGAIRRYGREVVDRVHFIRRAQQLGFSLDEIASLLELETARSCAETRVLAERKLGVIEERIADLERMRATLDTLVKTCHAGKRAAGCPIIESLNSKDLPPLKKRVAAKPRR